MITFKLRAARKSRLRGGDAPTKNYSGVTRPVPGSEGSLVALLIKLNTNIDGRFGPSWKRTPRLSEVIGDAATALDSTAREMLRRAHTGCMDDVPVNRGAGPGPSFPAFVAARSTPRAEAKAASPRSSCGSADCATALTVRRSMRARRTRRQGGRHQQTLLMTLMASRPARIRLSASASRKH